LARSRSARRDWWANLTSEQRAAYIERKTARKEAARQDSPSYQVREANARLDLATERGCFMTDIPDADVTQRIRENEEDHE
jgi:hypothetical protein